MRVIMVGADRSVHGGVSAVVNNYYDAGIEQKVAITYIGTMVDGNKVKKLLKALQAYLIFLFKISWCDIVHINMAADSSYYRKLYFIYVSKFFHKKIIIHQHGGNFQKFYYEDSSLRMQKKICMNLNKADKFIVLSDIWKDFFSEIVEKSKIEVLPNAVQLPNIPHKDYGNQNILFLGRLCEDKGICELIDAICVLKKEFPQMHLYLGGVWEDEGLKKLAEQQKDVITWLGWIEKEEKDKMLKKCSVFVLPSYFEGQPISVLEGMAYGCAVVVTPVGGLKSTVKCGENGIFVEKKNTKDLIKNLQRVLSSSKLREKLGQNGRKTIAERYELRENLEQLIRIYQKVIS